jgi:hypothetical protein
MNRRLARMLVRIYPRAWRERYGAEFANMLEDGPGGLGALVDVLGSALCERVLPTVKGGDMVAASRWETWGARAPWAVFGIAPAVLLAAAYFVALMILSTGWQMFLPNERTPFVPVEGWAVVWFGVGRVLYYGAPVLAGLWLAIVAARGRSRVLWPLLGAGLMAVIDGAVQVQAVRPSLSQAGRVQLLVADWHPGYSVAVMACTMAAYWLLRIRRERARAF